MSNLVIATVNPFNSGNPDKNGKSPVILNVVSGKAPNRNVLSGTVAENAGIETGKSYIFRWREIDPNEYGRQFRWTVVSEISGLELIKASQELGEANVFDVAAQGQSSQELETAPEFQEQTNGTK